MSETEKEFSLDEFDALIDEENQEKEEKKKKKSKKKSKDGSEKKSSKTKQILLRTVLPAGVTLISGMVLGMVFGTGDSSSQQKTVSPIVTIGDKASLSDSIQSVETAQNLALTAQLAEITGQNAGDSYSQDYAGAMMKTMNEDISKVIDPFLEAVVNVKPDASDEMAENSLRKFFAIEDTTGDAASDENTDAVTREAQMSEDSKKVLDNMRAFIAGPSIAKLYQTETAKAGIPFVSIAGFSTTGGTIYNVILPVARANDGKVQQAQYMLKVVSGKITAASFVGTVANNNDLSAYYKAISGQVEEAKKAEEENTTYEGGNDNLPQNKQSSADTDDAAAEQSSQSSEQSSSEDSAQQSNTEQSDESQKD